MLFEHIGLTIPQPPLIAIPKDLVKAKNADSISHYLYEQANLFFKTHTVLQPDNFGKLASEKKSYLFGPARQIFEDSIESILKDDNFVEQIYHNLSWDFVLKYQYGKELDRRMHLAFPSWYFGWTRQNVQFPAGRFLKVNWDRMYQLELKKSKKEKRAVSADIVSMNKSMDFGTKDDYVDTELLHKLITGTVRVSRYMFNPGEPGSAHLKIRESDEKHLFDEERIRSETTELMGWSKEHTEKFIYSTVFDLYDLDIKSKTFTAELWFEPKQGGSARKIASTKFGENTAPILATYGTGQSSLDLMLRKPTSCKPMRSK